MFKLIILLFFIPVYSYGKQPLYIALPAVPGSENLEAIKKIIKRCNELSLKYEFKYNEYSFGRAIHQVKIGMDDLQIPYIYSKKKEKIVNYTEKTFFYVNFSLYTLKDSKVTLDNLSNYIIATEEAHKDLFNSKFVPLQLHDKAIKMLLSKRIDGYVFADSLIDKLLKDTKVTNVKKTFYRNFPVKGIVSNTKKGILAENAFSACYKDLFTRNELKKYALEGWILPKEF